MKNERLSQHLFFAATSDAFLVYGLTAPGSLPWGLEAKMAGGAQQGLSALPDGATAAWRIWDYFVEMFAGNFVALACGVTAITAGCLAMVVNRYFGWRVATAASLVWTFLPGCGTRRRLVRAFLRLDNRQDVGPTWVADDSTSRSAGSAEEENVKCRM